MRNRPIELLPANERLRRRLDDFYKCADDCLDNLYVPEAFVKGCEVLCKEMDHLLAALAVLEDQYQEELPLESNEPKGVDWITDSESMAAYRDDFESHRFSADNEDVKKLVKRLDIASAVLSKLDEQLHSEGDPELYASYCKHELHDYEMGGWNKDQKAIRNLLATVPEVHRTELMQSKLKETLDQIRESAKYIIHPEESTIFYESLGRYIWNLRHQKETEENLKDVLCKVKTAEYYSSRLQVPFVYLDRENSPLDEKDATVRLEHLKQKTIQVQLEAMKVQICRCEPFLAKGYDVAFLINMLTALVNSELCEVVCDKMCNRKLKKFVHQFLGFMKSQDVMTECNYGELVDALTYSKPRKQSRIDYMRKGIDDVPEIEEWLVNYITEYKNKM